MTRDCGTCHPPADGTRDREIVDRFGDFLRAAGPAAIGAAVAGADPRSRRRSPAERYRLKLLVWRCGPDALDLAERLAEIPHGR